MKTIAIIVGHGPARDKGAVAADGTTELGWNPISPCVFAMPSARASVRIIARRTEGQPPVGETNATGVWNWR